MFDSIMPSTYIVRGDFNNKKSSYQDHKANNKRTIERVKQRRVDKRVLTGSEKSYKSRVVRITRQKIIITPPLKLRIIGILNIVYI